MNCFIPKYKDRILNQDLKNIDFNYSFEEALEHLGYYETELEMSNRLTNNGFSPTSSIDVTEYFLDKPYIEADDYLEIEPVIVKYLNKIIELCQEYDVKLIFYRVPYLANENELKK